MRKHASVIVVTLLVLAVFGVFAVWAVLATSHMGGGWASLLPIWPYVAGGLVLVGGLTGGLMWLAFYSSRHGYDDRVGKDQP